MPCDPDRWGPGTTGTICCGCVWFIVSIFLFGFSFDTLGPTEMGLLYDANLCHLDSSTVYNEQLNSGGRWWTGIGIHFIRFPKEIQVVKFNEEADAVMGSVASKTLDGSSVDMGLSMQYHLKRDAESLSQLYLKYGMDFEKFLVRYSRQVTRDVLAEYLVTELWEKRFEVGARIRSALVHEFDRRHVVLRGFQLLNLDIPHQLEDAIVVTTVEFQGIEKAQFELQAGIVSAVTARLTAEQDAQILVINAQGQAGALLLDKRARAKALNHTAEAEIEAYNHVKSSMNLDETDLLGYVWLESLTQANTSDAVFSVQQPTVTQE